MSRDVAEMSQGVAEVSWGCREGVKRQCGCEYGKAGRWSLRDYRDPGPYAPISEATGSPPPHCTAINAAHAQHGHPVGRRERRQIALTV
eukprot:1521877-Prymnesium_polylepis.1